MAPFDQLGIAGKEDVKSFVIRSADDAGKSSLDLDEIRILGNNGGS